MRVKVLREEMEAKSWRDLEQIIIGASISGMSCIWSYAHSGTQFAIMLNGRIGYPHWFPGPDHPGFQLAPQGDPNWNRTVDFIADNCEPTPMAEALTAPLDQIMTYAKEFFESGGQLPSRAQWSEL